WAVCLGSIAHAGEISFLDGFPQRAREGAGDRGKCGRERQATVPGRRQVTVKAGKFLTVAGSLYPPGNERYTPGKPARAALRALRAALPSRKPARRPGRARREVA